MSREALRAKLHALTHGLECDDAGTRRLMERISQHDNADDLRAVLVEIGAQSILDVSPRRHV